MKLKNIFFIGVALTGLTSCNDYLDVDTPSKYDNTYVFGSETEINRALNGVYAQITSSKIYGNDYLTKFCMNSDVDYVTNSNELSTSNGFRRFDCNSEGSGLNDTWQAVYQGIEYANNFVYQLENSKLYTPENDDYANLQQMMGEAKVIRAMLYHDLMWLWGDVPFSFTPTAESSGFVMSVASRDSINDALIADLKGIAPKMQYARNMSDGVERVSKEMAWAMIARIALTEGGYSLRPDKTNNTYGTMKRPDNYKDYYQIAHAYCDSVIKSGTHKLGNSYPTVFSNECNYSVVNDDDPIFEIPFAQKTSGNIGYIHGPKMAMNGTKGIGTWGGASGEAQVSVFYRYSFDTSDLRMKYIDGLWSYTSTTTSTGADSIAVNPNFTYTLYNNKWSKLWGTGIGNETEGSDGINYPYMRYTDVLLMDAEAENELNDGPTEQAKTDLKTVRARAFSGDDYAAKVTSYTDSVSSSKESFLDAVLNERKWEFGGENMRWKDLVRNNKYSEALYYQFLRYFVVAENVGGSSSDYEEPVEKHDNVTSHKDYLSYIPTNIYWRRISNANTPQIFPNTSIAMLEIHNPMWQEARPQDDIANGITWSNAETMGCWNEGAGAPQAQILYSLYGFIRCDVNGSPYVVNADGSLSPLPAPSAANSSTLPVVRYILPYPSQAIQRSAGAYKNYYGYLK
nr:RagB/SusD family nutrient uptake outer membrane protein [Prevotella sp.]